MIAWHTNPYALSLFACALLSGALAVYVWRRRSTPGGTPLAVFLIGATIWSAAYGIELGALLEATKIFWAKVQYLGIAATALMMLLMAVEYTGRARWLTPGRLLMLAVVPLTVLGLVWTNEAHGLIWPRTQMITSGSFPMLVLDHGLGFWAMIVYSYLCLLMGAIVLARTYRRAVQPYRTQAGLMLVGTLVPWLGNLLYVSGLNPVPNLDLTPFLFTVSGVAATFGLFSFRLLDLAPVARDTILENMADAVLVLDAQNRVVDVNPAFERVTGQAAAEMIGRPAGQVLSRWPDLVARYATTTETEAPVVWDKGTEKQYFSLRITPLLGRHGTPTGRIITLHDTTRLVETEVALREQQAQLEAQNVELRTLSQAVAQSANTVVITDTSGSIIYANPKFEETTGYRLAEALGQNPRILNSGTQDRQYYEELWRTITSGRPWQGEFNNRRKDGSLYWEMATIAPVLDEQGVITHYVAVKEEITERKRMESGLARLLDLSRDLAAPHDLEAASETIVRTALEIVAAADQCSVQWLQPDGETLHTLARSQDVALPRADVDFKIGTAAAGHAFASQQLINVPDVLADERFTHVDLSIHSRSLLVVPLIVRDSALGTLSLSSGRAGAFGPTDETLARLTADQIAAALETANLLEQLRYNVSELQARNQELDAFAHSVAHDLRNPVSVVLGYADMLATVYETSEDKKLLGYLKIMGTQARKMGTIINELLLLARLRTAQEVPRQTLDMQALAAEAMDQLRLLIAERGATILQPPSWPTALGYGPWVEDVWVNYISNACKYGGEPPCIELGATPQPDGRVRFWVRDSGPGLSAGEQARLFTPFERLHQIQPGGHGLGLSIVQRIMAALDGSVGVESDGVPGHGCTFYFELPAAPPA